MRAGREGRVYVHRSAQDAYNEGSSGDDFDSWELAGIGRESSESGSSVGSGGGELDVGAASRQPMSGGLDTVIEGSYSGSRSAVRRKVEQGGVQKEGDANVLDVGGEETPWVVRGVDVNAFEKRGSVTVNVDMDVEWVTTTEANVNRSRFISPPFLSHPLPPSGPQNIPPFPSVTPLPCLFQPPVTFTNLSPSSRHVFPYHLFLNPKSHPLILTCSPPLSQPRIPHSRGFRSEQHYNQGPDRALTIRVLSVLSSYVPFSNVG